MFHYTYKEFDITYDIVSCVNPKGYDAHGFINFMENDKVTFSQEFRTNYSTYDGVEDEIKKLMEHFIDFEWRQVEKKL